MTTELAVTPPENTVKLKWFNFSQNNSGGSFVVNDEVAHEVFIQAASALEAVAIAEGFLDNYGSCPCCGDRWSFWVDDSDGFDEPTKYGKKLSEMTASYYSSEVRLHYWDGRVEKITLPKE